MQPFALVLALCLGPVDDEVDAYKYIDTNRNAHLNETNPYYVHEYFAKLTTPQWIGEEGVEAVAVLSIDDMREYEKYEEYLRPIITRLQEIDGRAPVSIFTCFVQPDEDHFQTWIDEGLNIDIHTVRHPCPLMDKSDFEAARETYEQCVDVMNEIPRNRPVAYRMPCCDSLNTPSPRFYDEIFSKTSPEGAALTIDSSVFNIMTRDADFDFRKYLPFDSYVNTIEDYPYPYLINSTCLEIPCTVPSDWEGHNLQGSNNPTTVDDIKHAIDLVTDAKGVYVFVFHPHGWIRNDQVVSIIDHVVDTHGPKVKFMQFAEIEERIRTNLFKGHPLRKPNGKGNGIRLNDMNRDGYQDVIIANEKEQVLRLWQPEEAAWAEFPFPTALVDAEGNALDVELIEYGSDAYCYAKTEDGFRDWWFFDGSWRGGPIASGIDVRTLNNLRSAKDIRMYDLKWGLRRELIIAGGETFRVYEWDDVSTRFSVTPYGWPKTCPFYTNDGEDNGVRLHDLNGDHHAEILLSNEREYAIYTLTKDGWIDVLPYTKREGDFHDPDALPPFTVEGKNFGAWFHSGHIWWRNEFTGEMPDLVDRRAFDDLMKEAQ